MTLAHPGGPMSSQVLIRGRQEGQRQRRKCENKRRGQRDATTAKKCRRPLDAGQGKGRDCPRSLQRKHGPADTWILAQGTNFGLLISRTMRFWITCVLLRYKLCGNMSLQRKEIRTPLQDTLGTSSQPSSAPLNPHS